MSETCTTTKVDWAMAYQLYLGLATHDQIARLLGIDEKEVEKRAQKYNWYRTRAQTIQNGRMAIQNDLKRRIEENKISHQNFILDEVETAQEKIKQMEIGEPDPFFNDEGKIRLVSPERKLSLLEQHDNIARKTLKLDEPDKSDPNNMGFMMLVAIGKTTKQANLVNESEANVVEIETEQSSEVSKTDKLEDSQKDALRRSIPFDDKNAITGNYSSLIAMPEGEKYSKVSKTEDRALNTPLIPIIKGTGLPPLIT